MDDEDDFEARLRDVAGVLRRLMTPAQFEAQVEALEVLARTLALQATKIGNTSGEIAESYLEP